MNELYSKPLSRRQSYLYNKEIKAMKGLECKRAVNQVISVL